MHLDAYVSRISSVIVTRRHGGLRSTTRPRMVTTVVPIASMAAPATIVQRLLTDVVAAHHELDRAGLVAQVGEVETSVPALAQDTARQTCHSTRVGSGRQPGELVVEFGSRGIAIEADRVGLDPPLAQSLELGQPMSPDLGLEARVPARSVLAYGRRRVGARLLARAHRRRS